MKVNLKVNGQARSLDVPGDMPLLWALRDVLDLKGTKFGCGLSQCGACTIHFNGAATRSCVMPVSNAQGGEITTIEGLSPNGTHPVQRAWEELDVPQCGYCQAGQIMTASAFLARTPNPSDADIDDAMNENLCRCATYLRMRQAIHRAVELTAQSADADGPRRLDGRKP